MDTNMNTKNTIKNTNNCDLFKRLNTRLKVYIAKTHSDGCGGELIEWGELCECYGRIALSSCSKRIILGRVRMYSMHTIIVRRQVAARIKDYIADHRVMLWAKDGEYDVMSVENDMGVFNEGTRNYSRLRVSSASAR